MRAAQCCVEQGLSGRYRCLVSDLEFILDRKQSVKIVNLTIIDACQDSTGNVLEIFPCIDTLVVAGLNDRLRSRDDVHGPSLSLHISSLLPQLLEFLVDIRRSIAVHSPMPTVP